MAVDLASLSIARRHSGAPRARYDVIVLDRDLPKLRGDQVCRTLVERGSDSRVLMLCVRRDR
jgi:two-component system, OmpR family, response regulator VanR